jgi:hypothetical protein
MMKTKHALWMTAFLLLAGTLLAADPWSLRPPAVPLVTCDPYFRIWSRADRLTDTYTSHWTGKKQALTCLIRVDGKVYRLMGNEPAGVEAMQQRSIVGVSPTRTVYQFTGPAITVRLTFETPMLPDDLDALSRPVTYLISDVQLTDGAAHEVSLYVSASAELTVNEPAQKVVWSRQSVGSLAILRIGSADQPLLKKKGDDLRIDWGSAYLAVPGEACVAVGGNERCLAAFCKNGALPKTDDTCMPRATNDDLPVMAAVLPLGKQRCARHVILAYDDEYSIQYMGENLRPYWRRTRHDAVDLLRDAERDYGSTMWRCLDFDVDSVRDLVHAGGERYATLAMLAYRQAQAGNKLVADRRGRPMMFPKENFSNGCIGTVDVIYPMLPQFLLFNPELAKAALRPVLDYAASPRWKFPFAPHDLGTYPLANGQVYGGGEKSEANQMPVEESANLILLVAAVATIEGKADFAAEYWPQLTQWARYLEAKGFDPEKQLCTDDFAGHLAHNVNLSAKAILALGAYGRLCAMRGDRPNAERYHKLAAGMVQQWIKAADDGDHFRLAFDQPGTWSQKYNLVWDRILKLDLFPPSVAAKEMAFYRKVQNRYGLPLDNRKKWTKLDWTLWTATLTGRDEDFQALVGPVYDFVNATPDRVPLTDWYMTDDARMKCFVARPVVGGVFLRLLCDRPTWEKWARRGRQ